jgi:hypothetical protein
MNHIDLARFGEAAVFYFLAIVFAGLSSLFGYAIDPYAFWMLTVTVTLATVFCVVLTLGGLALGTINVIAGVKALKDGGQ